jgi:hypothetical protein
MAANTEPVFTLTPVIGYTEIATANTARDGSGTLGTVISGATNGTRITRVRVISSGSEVGNGMMRLFIDTSGSSVLYDECAVTATAVSASTVGFDYSFEFLGERALILPSGVILKASTSTAQPINVWAEGGNY